MNLHINLHMNLHNNVYLVHRIPNSLLGLPPTPLGKFIFFGIHKKENESKILFTFNSKAKLAYSVKYNITC